MKKALSIVLFMLSVVSLLGLAAWYYSIRDVRQQALQDNCTTQSSSEFSKQLSYGVILRDKTVAALKLNGERNFSLPGGNVEQTESSEDALIREFNEELSLDVRPESLRPYKTYCEAIGLTTSKRVYIYFVDDWQGVINVGDKDQLKWVESDFASRPDADTELTWLLNSLVTDGTIPKVQPTIESQFE